MNVMEGKKNPSRESPSCEDPEGFARGGPTLTTFLCVCVFFFFFFFFFFFLGGGGGVG